ncbi:MAG: PAS domain S-box protein [Promethearchaeota archaeon]|nr:MAG: PAS domain S-box protein [Candidatus Lokiarchaeota archaeon]
MASTTNFGYTIGDVLKQYLDDPIFILNKEYEFEYITENFLLKNLDLNTLEGKMPDILHPKDSQRGVEFLQKVSKFGQAVETLRVRYGDNFRFLEFKGRLFKNEAQETKYLIITRDITEFKKKEEDWDKKEEDLKKLTENMQEIRFWKLLLTKDEKTSFQKSVAFEKKYRQIIDNIKEAYFEVDLEGNFTYINKSFIQMTGYSLNELMNKDYSQIMDDENKTKVFEIFNLVYKSGLPQEYFQFEFKKKGNTKVIVETSVYLNKDTYGKKIGFYGITRDITQRSILEHKFKQSEEKYRHLFERSPYAIWIVDLKGVLIDCNPTTDIMFSKYKRGNLVGKNFIEVLGMLERPEYFIPFFKSKFESFIQGKPMKALEFKMTRADGIEKWINITSSKIKLGDKTLIQVIMQDITEKKIADLKLQRSEEELKILNKELEEKVQERTKELRESEEKFRTIAESSLMGIAIIQDNKIKYVNELLTNLTGYTADETKELSPAKVFEFIHPEDRNWVVEQLKKKQSGSSDYIINYQYRIINNSGEIRWLDNFSKTIEYMGKPADLVTVLDITDRKKAEQKLKESEEKFRTITEHSTIGIVIIQDGKINYVNNAMLAINEYTMDEMMEWSPKELLNNIHPEDRKQAIEYLKDRQTGDSALPSYSSYRTITKSGKIKWIDSYSKTITYLGRFADLALITDVTDQNLAKQALKESEEKYRLLFENMNSGFAYHEVLVDDNGKPIDYRFIEANSQYEKLTGLKVSDLIGRTVTEILPGIENDPADWIGKFGNVGLTGLPLNVEDYSEPLDRWYNVSGYSPKKGFFAATFSDITDRKRAEKKLKESEEKYRHLFENAPFSIALLNNEGKIIDMNPKTTELFGYKKDDLVDKNYLTLSNLFPKETIPGLRLVQDLMSKGEPSNPITKPQITKIYNKDKKAMWVASELSTINIGGELMILAIIQDITEKKLAEEKLKESERILRQQYIELKELDRLKTDFISIAAHDLKTPLISVGGYVDLILLREKGLNEGIKEDLNRVLNNVHRLDRYINRLLDVMKIEAKKVELVKREENIHTIIVDCLSDLEFQVSQKNLTVNVDISKNLNIRVDHFRISQAFLNLLSNAVKFTPKNGKIDISIVEQEKNVLFKIKDNGKGLTTEEIQKLFGKFVTIEQGVDGYSTMDQGSGLGLYIARGFIEAHGGKIWVESKGRDLGAEFSFTLPKQ